MHPVEAMEDWEADLSRAQREMLARLPSAARNATLRGRFFWGGKPVIDDDDGGTAGVREPRRPRPAPPTLSAAREAPEHAYA